MDRLTHAPQVWVTRTRPGAERTAARLAERGYRALIAPLLKIRPLAFAPPDPAAFDALAFTSASAVAAFAASRAWLDRDVFTVGDSTAAAASAAGFTRVTSAGADAAALAALVLRESRPGDRILIPTALRPAFDLAGALDRGGRRATALTVYATVAVDGAPPEAAIALQAGGLAAVLIHSPAAARVLATLVEAGGLPAAALSAACAAPLGGRAAPLAVAASPSDTALLDALDALRLHAAPGGAPDDLGKPSPAR